MKDEILRKLLGDASRARFASNLVMIIISIYGISQHSYQVGKTSYFQSFLIETLAPIQKGTTSLKEGVIAFFDHYIFIVNTSKKNVELNQEVERLQNEIFVLKEVQKENLRLKRLMEFGNIVESKKVLAQVVSWDSSEFKVIRINKGKADGLKPYSPVITMNGLVGYVYRLSENYSDVLTILDQNNRVDVVVARTRSHGIVEGNFDFTCRMKYVARTDDVKIGDEVLTAGLGEIYPKGLRVGVIREIDKKNYGIVQDIEIEPAVDFFRLEEVVVLIPQGEQIPALQVEEKL
jgi:rod shape-determining protein MreC